jgi:hypothetical protein
MRDFLPIICSGRARRCADQAYQRLKSQGPDGPAHLALSEAATSLSATQTQIRFERFHHARSRICKSAEGRQAFGETRGWGLCWTERCKQEIAMTRWGHITLHALAAAVFFASIQKFVVKSSVEMMLVWALAGAIGAGWLSWKQTGGGGHGS